MDQVRAGGEGDVFGLLVVMVGLGLEVSFSSKFRGKNCGVARGRKPGQSLIFLQDQQNFLVTLKTNLFHPERTFISRCHNSLNRCRKMNIYSTNRYSRKISHPTAQPKETRPA